MANLVQQSDQRHIASVSSKRGSNASLLGANLHLCTQRLVGGATKGESAGGFWLLHDFRSRNTCHSTLLSYR